MSDNDLIKRGDTEEARDELVRVLNYINSSGTLDYADYCELFNTIERVFDALKAVPQEMSAREFVATISDMCINQFPEECTPCPLWVAGHGCGEKILPSEDTVAIVEEWAREHPERSEDDGVD